MQVLRPYSNLSNLKIWDYFVTEDLAHGPSYDIEAAQREIRQNEDHEPVETIGQSLRKVVNGCYDNIMIQQPDHFQWQFQVNWKHLDSTVFTLNIWTTYLHIIIVLNVLEASWWLSD